jgi:superfamily I DNA/RNA helicase
MTQTAEQSAATKTAVSGKSMILQAGAGTGKTYWISQMAKAMPNRKGYYFAFNKAIVADAATKLPSNMKAYTIHGYAFGRKGRFYSHRVNQKYRIPASRTADLLGISGIDMDDHSLSRTKCAQLVMRAVQEYSKSADWQISGWHIPRINGIMPEEMKYIRDELDPFVKAAWQDIANVNGELNFSPLNYVKLWALDPRLSSIAADFTVFDEAQDVMSCVIPVLQRRERQGKQIILAGDQYQAINEWNGAEDSMGKFPEFQRLMLTQSFRFGQEVADIANLWLDSMEADMTITGTGNSEIGPIEFPDAILCKTNAGTIEAAIGELARDKSVALLGNTEQFLEIADSALALQANQPTDYYLFAAFNTWAEVQVFTKSDDPDADEIKTWVNLIDAYGAQEVKEMTSSLVSPENADVTISTAHKTKGLQFRSVRVAGFPEPSDMPRPLTSADKMLAYVTVTRPERALDPGNLASPDFHDMD